MQPTYPPRKLIITSCLKVYDAMVELHGEDYQEDIAPVDRLIIPSDICHIGDDDEYIYIVGTQSGKVTKIDGLQNMTRLNSLTLRCCLGK